MGCPLRTKPRRKKLPKKGPGEALILQIREDQVFQISLEGKPCSHPQEVAKLIEEAAQNALAAGGPRK